MKVRTIITKVAGVSFEGRQAYLAAMTGNEPVRIVPEPDNRYDPHALAVHVAMADGTVRHVGFVPRDLASTIAPHLEGEAVMARIDALTGGFEIPNGEIAAYGLRIEIEIPDDDTTIA